MLIAEALELLNEAAKIPTFNLTVGKVPAFSENFTSPKSMDDQGNLSGKKHKVKGTKTTVSNADKGTGSELVSLWYCASELKKRGNGFKGVLELGTVGTVKKDSDGKTIKKTAIALDLARTISRIAGFRAKYDPGKFKSDIWDQGVQQGKQILEVLDEYLVSKKKKRFDLKKVRLVGLGESAAATSSTLTAQEDCQLQMEFKKDASLDGSLAFSNKAGGSDPGMLNKTPLSAGLLTKQQLQDGMEENVDKIRKDTIALYKDLNGEVAIPEAVKKEYKKKGKRLPTNEAFWVGELCNQLKKANRTGKGEAIIDTCFNVADAKNFPDTDEDREQGYGVICPAKSKKAKETDNVSLSSCCTTVMGSLAKSILEKSLAEAITDMSQLFDLIMLGDTKKGKSIFETMYPSFYPQIIKKKKRNEIADLALKLMESTDGKYFCVNGKPGKSKEPMSKTHAIFRSMLLDVSKNSKKKWTYTIPTGDVNGITFNYDGQPILTISVRKDKSDKMKFSKASVLVVQKLKSNKTVSADELKTAAKEIEAQESPVLSMMGNVSPPDESPDMEVELEPVKMDGETQDVDPGSDGIETTQDASPVEITYPDGQAGESIGVALDKFPNIESPAVATDVIDDVVEVMRSLEAAVDKAPQSSKDPDKMTTRKIQDELLTAIPDHATNEKVLALVKKFGFASLATFNSQKIGIQKNFIKQLLKVVPNDKLRALHDKLIKENSRRRSMNGTYLDLIQETIAIVLREADDSQLIDNFVEDLFNAEPDKAGEVMAAIASEVGKELDGEEFPVQDQEGNPEEIQEGRWLKLAGLLKD